MQELSHVRVMVDHKYVFIRLRTENEYSLVTFVADKAAADC